MSSGSQPASWTDSGYSSARSVELRFMARTARIMAWLAIISVTTRLAPKRRTSRRKGWSVTPDIGARITG